jgi:hypothetical protein
MASDLTQYILYCVAKSRDSCDLLGSGTVDRIAGHEGPHEAAGVRIVVEPKYVAKFVFDDTASL